MLFWLFYEWIQGEFRHIQFNLRVRDDVELFYVCNVISIERLRGTIRARTQWMVWVQPVISSVGIGHTIFMGRGASRSPKNNNNNNNNNRNGIQSQSHVTSHLSSHSMCPIFAVCLRRCGCSLPSPTNSTHHRTVLRHKLSFSLSHTALTHTMSMFTVHCSADISS